MKKPFRVYINRMKFHRFTISELKAILFGIMFKEFGIVYYMNFHPLALLGENDFSFFNKTDKEIDVILNRRDENVLLIIDDISMLSEPNKKYLTELLNKNLNINMLIIGDKNLTLKNLHSINWHVNYELEKVLTDLITENKDK